ncbi:dehydrogenase [Lithospermum erythrorhizon]|uniref:CASP-like protein n=1 Tax=Lithospermum erythrorhizon TaxID=34254 RepID=A0AAV3QN50_LITER
MGDKRENGRSPMEIDIEEDAFGSTSVRTIETLLRLLPMSICIAALIVMIKNSQTNDYGSLSYSDLGAFRYLVHANGICAGYSLLTAIVAAVPRPSTVPRAWTFFILDQVLTYIILAAGATSTEVIYLAYKGDDSVTWSQACGSFGGLCRKATASVALTFIVTLCYACLSFISSYRLFSKYDPPVSYNPKQTEITGSQS